MHSNLFSNAFSRESVKIKHHKNRKNIYHFPLRLSTELIQSERQIPVLVELEKACFPSLMQEQHQDFETFLADEYAAGLILYEDTKPIGYIMGYHIHELNSVRALESSEFIRDNQDVIFYISSLAILKKHRSVIALDFLIHDMASLLKSIDYDYFVAYVRKRHGLSRLLARRVSCEILHTQENWEDTGEPFDYCLVNLASIPSLPAWADYVFALLRKTRRRIKRVLGHY